jgi:hypothetical protein
MLLAELVLDVFLVLVFFLFRHDPGWAFLFPKVVIGIINEFPLSINYFESEVASFLSIY